MCVLYVYVCVACVARNQVKKKCQDNVGCKHRVTPAGTLSSIRDVEEQSNRTDIGSLKIPAHINIYTRYIIKIQVISTRNLTRRFV